MDRHQSNRDGVLRTSSEANNISSLLQGVVSITMSPVSKSRSGSSVAPLDTGDCVGVCPFAEPPTERRPRGLSLPSFRDLVAAFSGATRVSGSVSPFQTPQRDIRGGGVDSQERRSSGVYTRPPTPGPKVKSRRGSSERSLSDWRFKSFTGVDTLMTNSPDLRRAGSRKALMPSKKPSTPDALSPSSINLIKPSARATSGSIFEADAVTTTLPSTPAAAVVEGGNGFLPPDYYSDPDPDDDRPTTFKEEIESLQLKLCRKSSIRARDGLQRRFLVVDNDPKSRKNLEKMLSNEGQLVTTAVDGMDCLVSIEDAKRKGEQFDVILVDLDHMPFFGGPQIVKTLRAEGFVNPIIGFTSSDYKVMQHRRAQRKHRERALSEMGAGTRTTTSTLSREKNPSSVDAATVTATSATLLANPEKRPRGVSCDFVRGADDAANGRSGEGVGGTRDDGKKRPGPDERGFDDVLLKGFNIDSLAVALKATDSMAAVLLSGLPSAIV